MSATVGLLHPGAMGVSVGAAAKSGGLRVLWASAGRGEATATRARGAGFEDARSLEALVRESTVAVSVCPPHGAPDLAREVAALGFRGVFVDANAVAPATARIVAAIVETAGARFVDGGIIGPPAHQPGTTRLYLSGAAAPEVAAVFAGTALDARAIEGGPGAASALKMSYAAWTKGADALLLGARALARAEGVESALLSEWSLSRPELEQRSEQAATRNAYKAWRFVGEMDEIADAFGANALPEGFHRAAADVYGRLERFKDAKSSPEPSDVYDAIVESNPRQKQSA